MSREPQTRVDLRVTLLNGQTSSQLKKLFQVFFLFWTLLVLVVIQSIKNSSVIGYFPFEINREFPFEIITFCIILVYLFFDHDWLISDKEKNHCFLSSNVNFNHITPFTSFGFSSFVLFELKYFLPFVFFITPFGLGGGNFCSRNRFKRWKRLPRKGHMVYAVIAHKVKQLRWASRSWNLAPRKITPIPRCDGRACGGKHADKSQNIVLRLGGEDVNWLLTYIMS